VVVSCSTAGAVVALAPGQAQLEVLHMVVAAVWRLEGVWATAGNMAKTQTIHIVCSVICFSSLLRENLSPSWFFISASAPVVTNLSVFQRARDKPETVLPPC